MGLYYNKTTSPVPVTLNSGRAILIPSRGREPIHGEEESSPALLAALKNHLVRLPEKFADRVAASSQVAVPAQPAEVVQSLPPVVAEPVVVVPPEESPVTEAVIEAEPELEMPSDNSESVPTPVPAEPISRADVPRRDRDRRK